ncbi:MAG: DUF5319 family protein [Actinobacteria bacterium]|nr:DUF5319 family protein [Actinomycetota bacterium]
MNNEEDPLDGPDPDEEGAQGREDPEDIPRLLPPEEHESVEADLVDLEAMRAVFQTQGAKGVVISCSDCGANHYYGWELLKESLEHMLETGEPRMHEPAFEPREDEYVVWDYGKGYVDALTDTGLEAGARLDLTSCGWCEAAVEPHFAFCSRCGRPLAVMRVYRELLSRGIEEREVRTLLLRAGFEPFGSG